MIEWIFFLILTCAAALIQVVIVQKLLKKKFNNLNNENEVLVRTIMEKKFEYLNIENEVLIQKLLEKKFEELNIENVLQFVPKLLNMKFDDLVIENEALVQKHLKKEFDNLKIENDVIVKKLMNKKFDGLKIKNELLNDEIAELREEVDDILQGKIQVFGVPYAKRQSIESEVLKSQVVELQAEVADVHEYLQQFRKEVFGLPYTKTENIECMVLKSEVAELRGEVAEIQQYLRQDNIEVVGIPYTPRENLYAITKKLAEFYEVPFESTDVSTIYRFRNRKKRGMPKIVLKFLRQRLKDEWMLAAETNVIQATAADIHNSWPPHPIYLNDHLTNNNKDILGHLWEMQKEKSIFRVWTRDCRILVMVAKDSPTQQVRTMEEVELLKTWAGFKKDIGGANPGCMGGNCTSLLNPLKSNHCLKNGPLKTGKDAEGENNCAKLNQLAKDFPSSVHPCRSNSWKSMV